MKINIIGDSHVRGYRDRKNIYPLFVGAGKEINLFEENSTNVLSKISSAIESYPANRIYLSLGEPNCRHQLGYGWYPQDHENVIPIVDEDIIKQCVANYILLLDDLENKFVKNISILTVSTCYEPLLPSVQYMNSLLIDTFNDKCVDLTESLSDLDYYCQDIIHMGYNISGLFLQKIKEMGHINSIDDFPHEEHITQDFGCIRLW